MNIMKNILLVILLLGFYSTSFSQTSDDKKVRYGFSLGLNRADFQFSEDFDHLKIQNNFGFNLGILMDYQLSNHFIISPKAELAFYEGSVNYTNLFEVQHVLDPIMIDLSAQLKYSIKANKEGFYIIAGPKVQIPLNNNSQTSTVFNFPTNYTLDIGTGFNLKSKYYNFSPEIKYSFGLRTINPNPTVPLVRFNSLSLTFNFLG